MVLVIVLCVCAQNNAQSFGGVSKGLGIGRIRVMSKCPHCERTEEQVKVGFTEAGSQRYMCKHCQRKYTPEPKEQGYDEGVRIQVLKLYVDGNNLRRIARIVGVSHQTVANWVNAHAASLPDVPPQPGAEVEVIEMDELFSFIEAKKTSSIS